MPALDSHSSPIAAIAALAASSPSGRDAVDDRAGEEAKHEHDERRPDQEQRAERRTLEHGVHDVRDPAVGPELGRREQHHDEEQQEEHRPSEASDVPREEERQHERDAQLRGEGEGRHAENDENLVEPGDQEEAHDETAAATELTQHVVVGHVGGNALLHRESLLEEHQTVGERRYQHEPELPLPEAARHVRGIHETEGDRDEPSNHKATRPARVQDVEMLRLFPIVQRGRDRVDYRFDSPVSEGEDERADV